MLPQARGDRVRNVPTRINIAPTRPHRESPTSPFNRANLAQPLRRLLYLLGREKVSGTVYRKLTWVLRTVEAREDRNDQFRKVGFIMCSTGSMLGSRIFTKHEDCISPEVLGASYWMWGQCDRRCGQHQSAWTFFCQSALFKTRAHGYAESPFRGALQKKPRQCLGFFTP